MTTERRATIAPVRRHSPDGTAADQDLVAVEAPLVLSVRREANGLRQRLGLVMRTPGHDDELVTGLLYAEGAISQPGDLVRLECLPGTGDVADEITAILAPDGVWSPSAARRLDVTSACGLCGRLEMLAVDPARACPPAEASIAAGTIETLPGRLRRGQAVFDETGGLHAAALIEIEGAREVVREDVGRHNAVDKVVGVAFRSGWLPGRSFVLAVSGRVAYEIVQKAIAAGVPVVASIGAPTSLAVDAARATGLTLVGFVRSGRFNVYAGWHRIVNRDGEISPPIR
jgi:FdhD protein